MAPEALTSCEGRRDRPGLCCGQVFNSEALEHSLEYDSQYMPKLAHAEAHAGALNVRDDLSIFFRCPAALRRIGDQILQAIRASKRLRAVNAKCERTAGSQRAATCESRGRTVPAPALRHVATCAPAQFGPFQP